jgi:ribonuclease HII
MLARMLVYAGIDEAGYGPTLGPLCVACTAFIVHEHEPDADICDLWKRLKKVICRKRTDKRRRIAVDDSKNLKLPNDGNGHPLKHLERGVLAFHSCAVTGAGTPCDDDLFRSLNVSPAMAAWYASTTPLPLAHTSDELQIAGSRLRRAFESEGVQCALMRCEAIDVEPFNRQVEMMGTKSSVNLCAVMRLIDSMWRRWPDERLQIVVDRQGGRTHYLQDLMLAYPEARVQILKESELISQYRVQRDESCLLLTFCVEADACHLPVALASMTAKYVRELFMIRLNRYFRGHLPELKPTAGYHEDAQRYLAEIESVVADMGIDRRMLVRCL